MRKNTKPHERGGSVLSHLFFYITTGPENQAGGRKDEEKMGSALFRDGGYKRSGLQGVQQDGNV